jgi:hypothetical protein
MKNKTIAAWLAFIGGPIGLHRFYLYGTQDWTGWLLPLPTILGLYGVYRVRSFGVDDLISWIMLPILGFVIAGCAFTAIFYGLTSLEQWNAKFNPQSKPDAAAGQTNWLTIGAVVLALLIGCTALIFGIVQVIQHYFEYNNMFESSKLPL